MAFWCRVKQSKLQTLPNQFKRYLFQVPGHFPANQTRSITGTWCSGTPTSPIHRTQNEVGTNVRFFAAPVQARAKQEEKDTSGPRLNEKITANFVRLVTEEGHSVVSKYEALGLAKSLKLDLVEVQRNANPPVCKIMDYHREKYKQQLKDKDRAKSKSEVTLRKGGCKEVRFSVKTEQKDLQIKADTAKRMMERGYRVKCMAVGTEEEDLGGLLSRLSPLIEDVSIVESGPMVEKRQAYVIVRHVKFGRSKKGKKPSKVVGATSQESHMIGDSLPTVETSMLNQVEDPAEPGLETEDEDLSEEQEMPVSHTMETPNRNHDGEKLSWSVFDTNDDFNSVFGLNDDLKATKPEAVPSKANNFLDLEQPRPRTETILPSPSEAPAGTINRYRTEPNFKGSPARPMDRRDPGARGKIRSVPPFSNQFRQPQLGFNDSPQEQLQRNAPGSTKPNYGIFGAPEADNNPGKGGLRGEVNRYKKGSAFDSTRQPSPQYSPARTVGGGRRT